jgi:trehalose 6-phosphate phosphatase
MHIPDLIISRERIGGAIFNLDGVVTQTGKLQADAWKRLFDLYLQECSSRDGEDYRPFDMDHDYHRYVDGRPRHQAVKHFLLARHVDLPIGHPEDPPDRETICGLGNRKNLIFEEMVEERGVEVNGCSIALIHQLRKVGIKTAVVSASKHCNLILQRAGIADLFDARVDGAEAERLDLDSKPDPDILLEAADRLGVAPAKTVLFEDTVVGITAGSRGHFALIVGVDPGGQGEKMREHGSDVVVRDLCSVAVQGTDAERERALPRRLTDFSLVSDRLSGRRPALFLDYGGTLRPIDDGLEDAALSEDVRLILGDAARLMPVVVVSGRDLETVSRLVGLPQVIYAGSHGMEIRGPDLRLVLPEGIDVLDDLDKAAEELAKALKAVPEARLEHKRFALVVHYHSQNAHAPARLQSAIQPVLARFPQLHLTGGKEVMELLPGIDWDKGRAVLWLLSELGLDGPDVLPIYIGDDVTDEDAFHAVRAPGLGILVSDRPQPSAATYWLKDPNEVAMLLGYLVESCRP